MMDPDTRTLMWQWIIGIGILLLAVFAAVYSQPATL